MLLRRKEEVSNNRTALIVSRSLSIRTFWGLEDRKIDGCALLSFLLSLSLSLFTYFLFFLGVSLVTRRIFFSRNATMDAETIQ